MTERSGMPDEQCSMANRGTAMLQVIRHCFSDLRSEMHRSRKAIWYVIATLVGGVICYVLLSEGWALVRDWIWPKSLPSSSI